MIKYCSYALIRSTSTDSFHFYNKMTLYKKNDDIVKLIRVKKFDVPFTNQFVSVNSLHSLFNNAYKVIKNP